MCHRAVLASQQSPVRSRRATARRQWSMHSWYLEAAYSTTPMKCRDWPCPHRSPRLARICRDFSPYRRPRENHGTMVITGRVLGVGLGQLGRRRVPLGQVHLPQVGPQAGDAAPLEPVDVGQPAVEPDDEELGRGAVGAAAPDEQPGQPACGGAARRSPRRPRRGSPAGACGMRRPRSRTARSTASLAVRHVAPLEGQLAELALDLGPVDHVGGQAAGDLEVGGGLLVEAPEHEDVAQALGHLAAGVVVAAGDPPLGDAVLALGDLEGVLRAGPVGGGQGVGEGAAGVAGGVEVVGQLEDPVGRLRLEGQGRGPVQGPAVDVAELAEQRLAQLVVDERAVVVARTRGCGGGGPPRCRPPPRPRPGRRGRRPCRPRTPCRAARRPSSRRRAAGGQQVEAAGEERGGVA